MTRFAAVLIVFVLVILSQPLSALAASPLASDTSAKTIYDVSWPNCQTQSLSYQRLGMVGVNDGLDFSGNPCLNSEARLFAQTGLYINSGYPGKKLALKYSHYPRRCSKTNQSCIAYDYGYRAGQYALSYAKAQHVWSTYWWVDVEIANSWSSNIYSNRASISGSIAAIKNSRLQPIDVGVYALPRDWVKITGNWQNKLAAWQATDGSSLKLARQVCSKSSFNGGKVILAQYTLKYDHNVVCDPTNFKLFSAAANV